MNFADKSADFKPHLKLFAISIGALIVSSHNVIYVFIQKYINILVLMINLLVIMLSCPA